MLAAAALLYVLSYVLAYATGVDQFYSDIVMSASTLLLILFCYSATKHFRTKTKILLAVCSLLNILYMVNLISLYLQKDTVTDYATIAIAVLATCVTARVVLISYSRGDRYDKSGTFLAYKKPKNLQGYIAAIFYVYGSMRTVINGREFKFKEGVFSECEHVESSLFTYRRIKDVPIKRARLMLGTKWKWYQNCFSIEGSMRNDTRNTYDN